MLWRGQVLSSIARYSVLLWNVQVRNCRTGMYAENMWSYPVLMHNVLFENCERPLHVVNSRVIADSIEIVRKRRFDL